jgi:hypothetical protein
MDSDFHWLVSWFHQRTEGRCSQRPDAWFKDLLTRPAATVLSPGGSLRGRQAVEMVVQAGKEPDFRVWARG